jgi:hypothetical protein
MYGIIEVWSETLFFEAVDDTDEPDNQRKDHQSIPFDQSQSYW